MSSSAPNGDSRASVEALQARLAEAEETLRAIRSGEVDALVVATSEGDRVFTLRGADEPYRIMLEQMSEGAASLTGDRVVLYANRRLAEMLGVSLSALIGTSIDAFVAPEDSVPLAELFASQEGEVRGTGEVTFRTATGGPVEAQVSVAQLPETTGLAWSIVATDITERVRAGETFRLRLYVAGQTPRSLTAFSNLRRICETHLAGRYEIEVIDLLEHPQLARGDEIIAVPTLVRKLPEPMKKLIGDLSDTDRVLVGLQLVPEARAEQR